MLGSICDCYSVMPYRYKVTEGSGATCKVDGAASIAFREVRNSHDLVFKSARNLKIPMKPRRNVEVSQLILPGTL